ncbi:M48 family metalloprotease [Nocardioides gilvus]|uniref:M48 family metalloprotease n=1 Tax=Nocardioides gilvus TaxID=1735589 RepID=UPI001EF6823A|nr:M48 family metalloprotease [Nocardioides gilvus]
MPWDPVPGGVGPLPEAEALFTTEELAAAESLAMGLRAWSWSSLAVSLLFFAFLGFTRVGPWLMGRLPGRWWLRVILGCVLVLGTERLVTLVFSVQVWRLRTDYGLSTQSWTGFLTDLLRSSAVSILVTTFVVLVLVGLARRWRRAWVPVAALLLAGFLVVGSWLYPVVVEPLFHDVEPLAAGELREQIQALAAEEGVELNDIVVSDASRRTTTLNAWVSGFGSTRRVVLYDNLVEDVPQEQALVVVAHELAHARHQDVLVGTALGAAGVAAAVGLLGLLLPAAASGGRVRAGSAAVVPLVLALVAVGSQLVAPVQNGISRAVELRADVTALCLTEDPDSFSEVQLALARRSFSDPTPPAWSQWWWGSHPGVLVRVALAERASCERQLSSRRR